MYAIIFDEHDMEKPLKRISSVHRTRQTAETALGEHRRIHGKKFQECNMRIVWVEKKNQGRRFGDAGSVRDLASGGTGAGRRDAFGRRLTTMELPASAPAWRKDRCAGKTRTIAIDGETGRRPGMPPRERLWAEIPLRHHAAPPGASS
jgi:hypothetical protein